MTTALGALPAVAVAIIAAEDFQVVVAVVAAPAEPHGALAVVAPVVVAVAAGRRVVGDGAAAIGGALAAGM